MKVNAMYIIDCTKNNTNCGLKRVPGSLHIVMHLQQPASFAKRKCGARNDLTAAQRAQDNFVAGHAKGAQTKARIRRRASRRWECPALKKQRERERER